MSARLHSLFVYRLSIPAWLIAAVVAAALAASVPAFLLGSEPSSSAARPDSAGNPNVGTSCIDNAVVGHC